MPSPETVCELVAALSDGELDPPLILNPTWRVNGKVLVRLDPRTRFFAPHWESSPSVLVWLDAVATGLLRELIADAWRVRVTRPLVREYECSR